MTTGTDDAWPAGFEIPYGGSGAAARERIPYAVPFGMIEARYADEMGGAAMLTMIAAPLAGVVAFPVLIGLGISGYLALVGGAVAASLVMGFVLTRPLDRAGREILEWAREAAGAPDGEDAP